jgi:chitin-binding protein
MSAGPDKTILAGRESISTMSNATFTADSTKYQFRVRATDKAGNLSAWSAPEEITVDTMPPESTVLPFIPVSVHTTTFQVEWTADDGPNGSGVQYIDIYSRQGILPWSLSIAQTTATSAIFTAPVEATYGFIAIGTDNLGNIEPFTGVPEAGVIVDINPPFVETAAYFPVIFSEGS